MGGLRLPTVAAVLVLLLCGNVGGIAGYMTAPPVPAPIMPGPGAGNCGFGLLLPMNIPQRNEARFKMVLMAYTGVGVGIAAGCIFALPCLWFTRRD